MPKAPQAIFLLPLVKSHAALLRQLHRSLLALWNELLEGIKTFFLSVSSSFGWLDRFFFFCQNVPPSILCCLIEAVIYQSILWDLCFATKQVKMWWHGLRQQHHWTKNTIWLIISKLVPNTQPSGIATKTLQPGCISASPRSQVGPLLIPKGKKMCLFSPFVSSSSASIHWASAMHHGTQRYVRARPGVARSFEGEADKHTSNYNTMCHVSQ